MGAVEKATAPGSRMLAEIREQPQRVHDAFTTALPHADRIRAAIASAPFVVLLGRGSSRSAATYGARAIGAIAGRPALVASPAELGWGEWGLPLEGAVVVAVSQSGESREMVAAAERARDRGAVLLVATNTPGSTLAGLASSSEHVLEFSAGAEYAVPATKSFTTSLACLLAAASAARPDDIRRARDQLPDLLQRVLDRSGSGDADLSGLDGYVLAGEGYGEAVAEEGAIKLRETLRVPASSFEASELLHGSINSCGPGLGVITVETDALSRALASGVVHEAAARGATTVHIGASRATGVGRWIVLPATEPAWAPFLAVVPLQLAARAAALARGLDPDQPEGLSKVTLIDYAA